MKGVVVVLLLSLVCFSNAASNEDIFNALNDFFYATTGGNWINNYGWTDPGLPFCQWFGIFCDEQAQTLAIKLVGNRLYGTIPNSLAKIGTNLSILLIDENEIYGSIPPDVATNFTNIWQFDVSENDMTGTVPLGFGSYKLMELYWIGGNHFSGNIPWDLESILPQVVEHQPTLGCRMGGNNFCCPVPPWVPVECGAGCNVSEICTEYKQPHISMF